MALTRADLAAARAVLEVRLGWNHPITQAIHRAHEATPPEPTTDDDHHDREEQDPWHEESPASSSR